jgi:hypothetical protein
MVIATEPFNTRVFSATQGLKLHKMATISRPKQRSLKITKVTFAFSNLFHLAKPAYNQNNIEFGYKINYNSSCYIKNASPKMGRLM